MKKQVYTTHDISKMCSVNITTVMDWIDAGKLKAYKTPGGHRRVQRNDLMGFFQSFKIPVPKGFGGLGKRVMVVDDDQTVVNVISRAMQKISDDVEIKTTSDGFKAGRLFESFQPDLVILDLMLPGLNGFEICREIRKTASTSVRVLAITGYPTEENRKKILSCGADRVMFKPFTPQAIQAAAQDLLAV